MPAAKKKKGAGKVASPAAKTGRKRKSDVDVKPDEAKVPKTEEDDELVDAAVEQVYLLIFLQ